MNSLHGAFPVFLFLSISSTAFFSFLAVASWAHARRRERESFYRYELLKRIADATTASANSALQAIAHHESQGKARWQTGLRITGLVVTASGLGLMIFLHSLIPDTPIFLNGLIPLLSGLALFSGSYFIRSSSTIPS